MTRGIRLDRSRRRVRSARPGFEPLEGRALLASLMVTNTLDSGAGSLRQAITAANAATGASTIGFAIPGSGVRTITPVTGLPAIAKPVTIDATTQPGYAGTPVIVLDGPARPFSGGPTDPFPAGLEFDPGADGSVVRGLAIVGFGSAGIDVAGPRVTVESNDLGVAPTGLSVSDVAGIAIYGTAALPSGQVASPGSIVQDNVIGGNLADGIDLYQATGVTIAGNIIGTDATGLAALGNKANGILASSGTTGVTVSGNTIVNNGRLGIDDQSGGGLTLVNNAQSNNGGLVANLSVTSSSSSLAVPAGQIRTVTYTVTNNGPATAPSATLFVASQFAQSNFGPPPAGLPIFQITDTQASTGTVDLGPFGNESTQVDFGTLAPGASATATVTIEVFSSGQDSLVASASSQAPTTITQGQAVSTAIHVTGMVDLSVAAQVPAGAKAGVPETFTFTVTNHDQVYSTEALIAVQFTVPGGGSAQGGVLVGQGTVTALPAYVNGFGGDLGRLAPGNSATVTVVVIPPSGGVVSAAVFAYSSSDVDPAPADNLAFAATTAAPATPIALTVGALAEPTTGAITSIIVDLFIPLNVAAAQAVANYRVTSGSTVVAVRSATYNTITGAVTLRLARSLPRSGPALTVRLSNLTVLTGRTDVQPVATVNVPRA